MENFVLNLRRMIGDESPSGDFLTPVNTLNQEGQPVLLMVPNFTRDNQEDVYPKIVLNAWISFLPLADEEEEFENKKTKTTIHEGRIQIDIFTKDELQMIDITKAVVSRFEAFFDDIEFLPPWKDVYGWEDYNSIKRNPNYDTQRNIVEYGDYTLVSSIEEVEQTPNSWFLDDTGIYVNGDIDKEFLERINGVTFPDGDTAAEKGFTFRNKSIPLRELPGDEDDTLHFIIEYEIFYNISRDLALGQPIDVIGVNSQEVS